MKISVHLLIGLSFLIIMTAQVFSQVSRRKAGIEAAGLKKKYIEGQKGENELSELVLKIEEIFPEDIDYNYIKGESLFREKKYTEALLYFELYTKQFPKALESQIRVAETKFLLNRKEDAFSDVLNIKKLMGHDLISLFDLYERVHPFLKKKQEKHFLRTFDILRKDYGYGRFQIDKGFYYKSKNKFDKALEIYLELISKFKNDDSITVNHLIDACINASEIEMRRGHSTKSIDFLSKAIAHDPYSFLLYSLRCSPATNAKKEMACQDAYLLKLLDHLDVSFDHLNCSEKDTPFELASRGNKLDKQQEMRAKFKNLVEAERLVLDVNGQQIAQTHFYKYSFATALHRIGKSDSALTILKEIEKEYSKSADFYDFKADIYMAQKDTTHAIKNLEKSIRLDPFYFDSYSELAEIYTKQGKYKKSIELYSNYITLFPTHANAYIFRGQTYKYYLEDLSAAKSDYRDYLEIKKLDAFILDYDYMIVGYDDLAYIYYDMKDYKNALMWLEQEIYKNPQNHDVYFFTGKVKAKTDDLKGACEEWKTAKDLGNKKAAKAILNYCE